ncbi:hypothetical protein FGO68_gene14295 [Halteria grandinella]|uniref:EF-hand domain-containing protein n=1 Tax=Halteria grandinella TaxID=5974 RepID=A0A8J8NQC1_HALGN|nr:hypothetical protein FGO68_gene14295 [Halteria grandinella]
MQRVLIATIFSFASANFMNRIEQSLIDHSHEFSFKQLTINKNETLQASKDQIFACYDVDGDHSLSEDEVMEMTEKVLYGGKCPTEKKAEELIEGSTILKAADLAKLQQWFGKGKPLNLDLIYRSTEGYCQAQTVWNAYLGKTNILAIGTTWTGEYTIGYFTSVGCPRMSQSSTDYNAAIFSLTKGRYYRIQKNQIHSIGCPSWRKLLENSAMYFEGTHDDGGQCRVIYYSLNDDYGKLISGEEMIGKQAYNGVAYTALRVVEFYQIKY